MKIKIYNNIQDLTGIGEEWLADPLTGEIRAVFIDGDFQCAILRPNFSGMEVTKIVA